MEDNATVNSGLPDPVQPEPSAARLISGFLGTAKAVLLSPRVFFAGMPLDGGLFGPYFFFFLCTLFFILISLVLNATELGTIEPWALLMVFLALWMPFVSSALLFFILSRIQGTTGSYEATFRVVCYASAVNLLAWVPIVGILCQFYEVYLTTVGLSIVHRTSIGRALLAVIGTALTLFFAIFLAVQAIFV